MRFSFFFSTSFKRSLKWLAKKYPRIKDDVRVALHALEQSPQLGMVIPAGYSIRKLRVRNSDVGRGKSGGYRLLYLVRPDRNLICLLLVYSKSDQAAVDRTELAHLVNLLRQDLGEMPIHEEVEAYTTDSSAASLESSFETPD